MSLVLVTCYLVLRALYPILSKNQEPRTKDQELSSFFILHSSFFILHSSFFILNSSFRVDFIEQLGQPIASQGHLFSAYVPGAGMIFGGNGVHPWGFIRSDGVNKLRRKLKPFLSPDFRIELFDF